MLPEAFLIRIQRQLGNEYDAFLKSLERPRAVALRFNPLKGPAPSLPFVADPVPWEPQGFYYDPDTRPGLHPYHEAGVYYLHEASAMSAVALLSLIKERGFQDGNILRVAHCNAEENALALRNAVLAEFPHTRFILEPTTALCSFYAEEGGLIIGFEGDFNEKNDNRKF